MALDDPEFGRLLPNPLLGEEVQEDSSKALGSCELIFDTVEVL